MLKTFIPLIENPWLAGMRLLDNIFLMPTRWIIPLYKELFRQVFRGPFRTNGKQIFIKHYEDIRKSVPPHQLLEYEVSQGWEPLCKFIGREIPDSSFPTGNGMESFRLKFRSAILQVFGEYFRRTLKTGICIGFLLWAVPKLRALLAAVNRRFGTSKFVEAFTLRG